MLSQTAPLDLGAVDLLARMASDFAADGGAHPAQERGVRDVQEASIHDAPSRARKTYVVELK